MHALLAVLMLQQGLWSVDTTFGPAARGELVIRRASPAWVAEIAGRQALFQPAGDSIRFVLPDSTGRFRGTLAHGSIAGFWIQPAGVTTGQSWASPLALRAAGAGQWRGTVVPLADRLRLYLSIAGNADGSVTGVFRNPESNWLGTWYSFTVTRAGDSLLFDIPAGRNRRAMHVGARYDSAAATIALRFPIIDRVVLLHPQDSASATGLFLRLPRRDRYVYRPPPVLADGWRTSRAASVGIDEAVLARLVQQIADTDPHAIRAPLIHSLLIARHGRLVLEEYFAGYDRATPHDTRSGGKTFAGVMVGAVHLDPQTRVKDSVTVAHLLTHTSGLACDDNDDNSPGNEDNMQAQTAQPDWWQYILGQPQVHPPGAVYAYCSGGMNLVGYALHRASGEWIPELFDRTVARPLGFGRYYYNLMPTLDGYLGGGVHVLPRDLLKLGVAYLDGGVWNGRRVVDSSWVRRSTTSQVAPGVGRDGYAWHLFPIKVGEREYAEYEANGNGGQFLIVVPELDLAVVFTGGNYTDGGVWWRWRQDIVGGVIIPAIR
jgi:CubicO group peptidase (beta-lactamase class C family)